MIGALKAVRRACRFNGDGRGSGATERALGGFCSVCVCRGGASDATFGARGRNRVTGFAYSAFQAERGSSISIVATRVTTKALGRGLDCVRVLADVAQPTHVWVLGASNVTRRPNAARLAVIRGSGGSVRVVAAGVAGKTLDSGV
jgi:hypothetical protein